MNANDVVELLEAEWQSIKEQLKGQWDDFAEEYLRIVASLPEEPSRDDMERTADAVCQLMKRYDYTRGLLRGWQSSHAERLLSSAEQSLSEKEIVHQVCNRFRQLAEEFKEGKLRGEDESQDNKACEGN